MGTANSQSAPASSTAPASAAPEKAGTAKKSSSSTSDRAGERSDGAAASGRKAKASEGRAHAPGNPTEAKPADASPKPSRKTGDSAKRTEAAGRARNPTWTKPVKGRAKTKASPNPYGPSAAYVSYAPGPYAAGTWQEIPVLLRSMELASAIPSVAVHGDQPDKAPGDHGKGRRNSIARDDGLTGPSHAVDAASAGGTDAKAGKASEKSAASFSTLRRHARRALGRTAQWFGKWRQKEAAPPRRIISADRPPVADKGSSPVPAEDRRNFVPEAVASRFLQVKANFYFPDRTLAFSDRGDRLVTRGAHPEVVRSLIEIAQARDWTNISVKGTSEFRRRAWLEGSQAGLRVAGYKPTALDLAELERRPLHNSLERGKLIEHSLSSAAEDRRADGGFPVKDKIVKQQSLDGVRKARAFASEKPEEVVQKHPELAPSYGVIAAAKKFAEAKLPREARDAFVGIARRHVIQRIMTGEAVKGPRIYQDASKRLDAIDKARVAEAVARAFGKAPRAKEVARER